MIAMQSPCRAGATSSARQLPQTISGCAAHGVGDRVGPDLRGITQRRDQAWLSSYIRNPVKTR